MHVLAGCIFYKSLVIFIKNAVFNCFMSFFLPVPFSRVNSHKYVSVCRDLCSVSLFTYSH